MESKMTIAYGITLYNVLDRLLYVEGSNVENPVEREIPFGIKYKLQRDADVFLKDYAYYQDERSKLVKQYGEEKDDKIVVTDENQEKFKEDLLKVISLEVSHDIMKLTPEEVAQIEGDIKVNCTEMNLFIAYLVEDEALEKDIKTPIEK